MIGEIWVVFPKVRHLQQSCPESVSPVGSPFVSSYNVDEAAHLIYCELTCAAEQVMSFSGSAPFVLFLSKMHYLVVLPVDLLVFR